MRNKSNNNKTKEISINAKKIFFHCRVATNNKWNISNSNNSETMRIETHIPSAAACVANKAGRARKTNPTPTNHQRENTWRMTYFANYCPLVSGILWNLYSYVYTGDKKNSEIYHSYLTLNWIGFMHTRAGYFFCVEVIEIESHYWNEDSFNNLL